MSMEERISRVIAAFDAQGWHRTATEVDAKSAEWFASELGKAGTIPGIESYPFRRLVPEQSFVELADGTQIEGLPLFDSMPTAAEGVCAQFGDGEGEIRLVAAAAGGHSPELASARESNAAGVVMGTTGPRPGFAPKNAEQFRVPFGRPALQLTGTAIPALQESAAKAEPVRLVSTFHYEDAFASNVTGVVAGSDPTARPVVVMTPRSGWWQCASERGGGIAVLLEIARAVAAAPAKRTVYFLGTTGHELGYWGLEEFLLRRPGLDRDAVIWVHFGASVGAAIEPRPMIYASTAAFKDEALECLKAAGATLPTRTADGTVAGGESRNIHYAGGDYVSLAGGSAVFHLEEDRWPIAMDVPLTGAISKGMTEFVLRVANSE